MNNLELPTIKVVIPVKNKSLFAKIGLGRKNRIFLLNALSPYNCHKIVEMKKNDVLNYQDKANYIIARAIKNGKKEPSKKLITWLDKNLNSKETALLLGHVNTQFNADDFIKSIVLMKGLNVLSPD